MSNCGVKHAIVHVFVRDLFVVNFRLKSSCLCNNNKYLDNFYDDIIHIIVNNNNFKIIKQFCVSIILAISQSVYMVRQD